MHMLGHNSAPFGETLADVDTILGDDHETVFHYAQWHINDYVNGTVGMQLEQEGAYIRFLMRLYQRGKPLPDDDRFMAICMNLSVRVWKRVKESLIAVGKIISKCGCLTNARFEKERRARADIARKQAEAARLRWERQRAEKMGLTEVSAKFAGSLDETSAKLSANFDEKLNEINVAAVTEHMLTNNQYPLTIEERTPVVPLAGDAIVRGRKRLVPEEYSKDFTAFWDLYPRKTGKGAAARSWERLTLGQKRKAYVALKAQLPDLLAKMRDPRGNYCPHASTWLNEGRFDDEPAEHVSPQRINGKRDVNAMTAAEYEAYLEAGGV
jgi:uncharacterized protein YdaU (DUF1376 family)